MELDAGERAGLDRRDERAVVVDFGDTGGSRGFGRVAVCEVDIPPVEPVEEPRGTGDPERVPAHVGNPAGAQAPDRAGQQPEPATALLALLEQELHAHADPE